MSDEAFKKIFEKLESKQRDCFSFSKKYETRKMDELFQYYQGANWAIDYAISIINEIKKEY